MFLISYFLGRKTNLLCGRSVSHGFGLGYGFFLFFYLFIFFILMWQYYVGFFKY